ncbi:MAG: hypothetical protein ACLUJG_07975 [Lawsonibacter sp.]
MDTATATSCHAQMGGRACCWKIGVGVHPAVKAQVGEFCEQRIGWRV